MANTGFLPPNFLLKGRYRLISQLGIGGFGAVYKGVDIQLGNRFVAIKEMSQKGLTPQEIADAAKAFEREAQMLAGLFHPNLPRIYDHFTDAGRWYLVMDFIEGKTLEELLQKANGTFPLKEVLETGIQLCTVLSYLHQRQPPIIFRDLKPDNVMRTPVGNLFLIDFGIARVFKPGQTKDTFALGSPGYAAPEQYGKKQTTPQSDIYSLGATLHRMLSGNDPADSPFVFAPLTGGSIPAGLSTVITQMVQLEERKRPVSIEEVKQQLQNIAAQQQGNQLPQANLPVLPSGLQPVQHAPQPVVNPPVLYPRMLQTYTSHTGSVQAVAWSPNSKYIASGGLDKTIHVWEAATGRKISGYTGHTVYLTSVAWSPDGKYIASGSYDKTIHVWEAATGRKISGYTGHTNNVLSVAWSPDGKYIASGAMDLTVQVWEALTGSRVFTHYCGHDVNSVPWSPDGKYIALGGGSSNTVHVLEVATRAEVIDYPGHSDHVHVVAWSPDGKYIASGAMDHTVQIRETLTWWKISDFTGHVGTVLCVAWSPNSKYIASGCYNSNIVQIWEAATGRKIANYGHKFTVLCVAWSPDGKYIASGEDGLSEKPGRVLVVEAP